GERCGLAADVGLIGFHKFGRAYGAGKRPALKSLPPKIAAANTAIVGVFLDVREFCHGDTHQASHATLGVSSRGRASNAISRSRISQSLRPLIILGASIWPLARISS